MLAPETPPNYVFVLLDDLRWDELGCMGHPFARTPNVDRLAREGALFRNAFVTTPLCSPSRASILTGQYAHTHTVTDNTTRDTLSHRLMTFPRVLERAGYDNGFVGKWHMGNDDSPRPGFSYWVSFPGQGTYINPPINTDGKRQQVEGYMTDILNQRAVAFLKRKRSQPFLLYLSHKAVHPELHQAADGSVDDPNGGTFIPAPRHRNLFVSDLVPHRKNYKLPPLDKPALLRKLPGMPPLGPSTATDDETIRNRARVMAAVDEGIGQMRRVLEESGQLDRTVFVFTSDQGYFYGEHCLNYERRLAYEESIRIPLVVRYPRLIRPGTTIDEMALNIDLAPTLLELAGMPRTLPTHGASLVPSLAGRGTNWRTSFLIEHSSDNVFPRVAHMGYVAVRTERWKYIHYRELKGMDELYDLQADPYELHNLNGDRAARQALAKLQPELERLLQQPAF